MGKLATLNEFGNSRSEWFSLSRESYQEASFYAPFRVLFPSLPLSRACTVSGPYVSPIGIDRYVYRFAYVYLLIAIGAVGRNLGSNSRKPARTERIGNIE